MSWSSQSTGYGGCFLDCAQGKAARTKKKIQQTKKKEQMYARHEEKRLRLKFYQKKTQLMQARDTTHLYSPRKQDSKK
jgi:hypothetical protein